jgi:hypothetical protein
MKNILAIGLIFVLVVGTLCSCDFVSDSKNPTKERNTSKISQKQKDIDGYEYAVYDKFNSYAEDNGLKGTKIYAKGTVKSVIDYADSCELSIKTSDSERWIASFVYASYSDLANNLFDEQEVTCFGTYGGYSDVFLMPVIYIDKVQVGSKTYTAEDIAEGGDDDFTEEKTTTVQPTKKAKPKQKKNSTNQVIFNNRGIKLTFTGTEKNEYETGLKFLVENNSGHDYTIQLDEVSVNGFMIEPTFSCDVNNGKKANDIAWFDDDELKDNGINKINKVEFTLQAFNWDDDSNDFNSAKITLVL